MRKNPTVHCLYDNALANAQMEKLNY